MSVGFELGAIIATNTSQARIFFSSSCPPAALQYRSIKIHQLHLFFSDSFRKIPAFIPAAAIFNRNKIERKGKSEALQLS